MNPVPLNNDLLNDLRQSYLLINILQKGIQMAADTVDQECAICCGEGEHSCGECGEDISQKICEQNMAMCDWCSFLYHL